MTDEAQAGQEGNDAGAEQALNNGAQFDSGEDEGREEGNQDQSAAGDEREGEADSAGKGESAEGSEGGHKKVSFTPEQQEVFNREISKQTAKRGEVERRAAELEKQVQELQSKIPKTEAPEIPPMPDRYDPDFEKKLEARDKAIQDKAAYDLQQRIMSEARLQQQQNTLKQQKEAVQKANADYVERGEKLGYETDSLISATNQLIDAGLPQNAQVFLRDDKSGPDMAMYLYKNPAVLNEVLEMGDIQAIVHLATVVREQAVGSARNKKTPPAPPEHLSGKGASEGTRGPKGATFE